MTLTWTKSGALMEALANPLQLKFETSSKSVDSRTKLAYYNTMVRVRASITKKDLAKTIDRRRLRAGARLDFTRSAKTFDQPRAGHKWPATCRRHFLGSLSVCCYCLPTVVYAYGGFCPPRLLTLRRRGLLRSACLPHHAAVAQISYVTSWLIADAKTARIWTPTNPRRPKRRQSERANP